MTRKTGREMWGGRGTGDGERVGKGGIRIEAALVHPGDGMKKKE